MAPAPSGKAKGSPADSAPTLERDASRSLVIAFERLLRRAQPTAGEILAIQRAARRVRQTLTRRLGTAITRVIKFGSIAKGVGLRDRSDLDMLFVVSPTLIQSPDGELSSAALLRLFRNALSRRFWSSRIRRDGQAVTVFFSRAEVALDVVPALPNGRRGSANMYRIPDGRGGWLLVAPTAEHAQFRRANRASQGKLGRAIQLLKLWRFSRRRPIPLRSYYVELALSTSKTANGGRSYAEILERSFRMLYRRNGRPLKDPARRVKETSMLFRPVSMPRIQRLFRLARDDARQARRLARAGDVEKALRRWQRIFNGRFLTSRAATR